MKHLLLKMYGPFLGLLLSMCFFNPTDGDSNLPVDDRVKTFFDAEVIYDEKREQTESTHVFKESVPRLLSRHDLEKISRMHHDHIHDVIFVIRPKNMDELTRVLHDISYPSSKNYGQHWTRDEVFNLTSNPEACDAIVTYLHSHGVSAVSESLNGEYITATAPIIVWEEIFNTEFFTFHQTHRNGRVEKLVRAEEYWIPKALESHIESVFNTIQMPYHLSGNLPNAQSISKLGTSHFHTSGLLYDGLITPLKIRHYYNMSTSVEGSSASTQAVYAPNAQYYSPVDLKFFQVNLAPPNRTVTTTTVATYSNDTICRIDLSSCATSNGALQYLMSTSSVSPTTYWYSDQSISDWLVTVSNSANPPLVLSISYVTYESYMSVSELNAFTIAAIKLSTMGVTIVVSSGDDGAVGEGVTYDGVGVCGYAPTFPASNPYVVSVGTTMVRSSSN